MVSYKSFCWKKIIQLIIDKNWDYSVLFAKSWDNLATFAKRALAALFTESSDLQLQLLKVVLIHLLLLKNEIIQVIFAKKSFLQLFLIKVGLMPFLFAENWAYLTFNDKNSARELLSLTIRPFQFLLLRFLLM